MAEKRRGLGRGLGALIPSSSPSTDARPVDVFFPGAPTPTTVPELPPLEDGPTADSAVETPADLTGTTTPPAAAEQDGDQVDTPGGGNDGAKAGTGDGQGGKGDPAAPEASAGTGTTLTGPDATTDAGRRDAGSGPSATATSAGVASGTASGTTTEPVAAAPGAADRNGSATTGGTAAGTVPVARSDANADAEGTRGADATTGANAKPDAEAEPDADATPDSDAASEGETTSVAAAKPDADVASEGETKAVADAEAGPSADSESGPVGAAKTSTAADVGVAPAAAGEPSTRAVGEGSAAPATSAGATSAAVAEDETSRDASGDDVELVPVPGVHFAELPVGSIRPNPRQPRTVFDPEALAELVGSIREIGVLQPIVVRPVDDGVDGVRYELIMGERRWRATQEAGLAAVPAIVRETEDGDLLRDALLENLHRSQLNPLEEAAAYQQLLDDFGCTHEELAQRIHRSRPQISNTLRLLRLPPLVQRRVAAGVLSAGHARALLGLPDAAAMERLAQRIVAEGLSVRATEEIVTLGGDPEKPVVARRPQAGGRVAALDDLAARLSDRFDTRVKVALGRNKGKLTIEFASVQDLNRVLEVLSPEDPGVLR